MGLLLALVLLSSLSQCRGQVEVEVFSNSSTLAPTLSPLSANITTPSPSVQAPPPVLPPTTSYFSVSAWFLLQFHLNSTNSSDGIMDANQIALFTRGMEGLTQNFTEEEEGQKVVTMCHFSNQLLVTDSQSRNNLTLVTKQQSTNTTMIPTTAPVALPIQTYYYEYAFTMTYLSTAVNVSQFPQRFHQYTITNVQQLTLELQNILELAPQNNLQITGMQEVPHQTIAPTMTTSNPTISPTTSPQPSSQPSISLHPSLSPQPSKMPSIRPTQYPSHSPSEAPTMFPTFGKNITSTENFALVFDLQAPEGAGYLNSTQEDQFCQIMENQTYQFAPDEAPRVRSNCVFFVDTFIKTTTQVPIPTPPPSMAPTISYQPTAQPTQRRRRWLYSLRSSYLRLRNNKNQYRKLLETYTTTIYTYTYQFRMRYASSSANVSDFTELFQDYIVENSEEFNIILTELLGLEENNNLTLKAISTFETKSEAPTYSKAPSESPTHVPTVKQTPLPSYAPTLHPTIPPPTAQPSVQPTAAPSQIPTLSPIQNDQTTIIIVVAVVAVVAAAILIAMAWFYRTRRQTKLQREAAILLRRSSHAESMGRRSSAGVPSGKNSHNMQVVNIDDGSGSLHHSHSAAVGHNTVATSPASYATGDYQSNLYPHSTTPRILLSPSTGESILSNPSLLSNGEGDDDDHDNSDDDDDLMHDRHSKLSPLDDFDRFKDQNLEKMRSGVQDSVSNMDGMLSQAMTMAILGGVPSSESIAGNDGIEMEANALCEVTDWVKRHDIAMLDERQSFLQEMLNKMVTSVRNGIMGPDDASRTIHECAGLLGLQLVNELPNNTVILSGMRKTVRANDVIRTFRKFGPIDDAAVASNQRGFGLVRFRNTKTVDQVMDRFRKSEIVVQDVAVQCRTMMGDPER